MIADGPRDNRPPPGPPVPDTARTAAAGPAAAAVAAGASLTPTSTLTLTSSSRRVSADTIEDAYVAFILHCNPAVPADTDTAALRAAFRAPPRSGGRTFDTWALFQLVSQLESGEIKTWAELVLRLGVEPPDQDRGQSVQKIPQYAARLKRWMKSMHMDGFFEYLLGRPHPYWTEIPTGPNPIMEGRRDGIMPSEDMALRALFPDIRPKRGRKRPDSEEAEGWAASSPLRPRIDSPATMAADEPASAPGSAPWPAYPEPRGAAAAAASSSSSAAAGWQLQDPLSTPYPMSTAMPPSTNPMFWTDTGAAAEAAAAEPVSAPTQAGGRPRRYGAKRVSSAWRQPGKTRGRPPLHREPDEDHPYGGVTTGTPVSSSLSPEDGGSLGHDAPEPAPPPLQMAQMAQLLPCQSSLPASDPLFQPRFGAPAASPSATHPATYPASLPAYTVSMPIHSVSMPPYSVSVPLSPPPCPQRPRRSISLQMSGRDGDGSSPNQIPSLAAAAAATGPPGRVSASDHKSDQHETFSGQSAPPPMADIDISTVEITEPRSNPSAGGPESGEPLPAIADTPINFFRDMKDRTHLDTIQGLFVTELLEASWVDANNRPLPPCGLEEASAIYHATMETLRQSSTSDNAFLMKVAALAGGRVLKASPPDTKMTRLSESEDINVYKCEWEYKLGVIRGSYSLTQRVQNDTWQKKKKKKRRRSAEGEEEDNTAEPVRDDDWKERYTALLSVVTKQDKRIFDLKSNIIASLRERGPDESEK